MLRESSRRTRQVRVGSLDLGGGSPVRIQTMWKAPLTGSPAPVLRQIERFAASGCELIRFAVPDAESAEKLEPISRSSALPVVADIHFDHRLALRCLDFVHKLRINPGNIVSDDAKRDILSKASDRGVPIRIGINGGSLPHDLRKCHDLAEAMVLAAERELEIFDRADFRAVVVSVKASDIESTVRANEILHGRYDVPLHLGLTEAGPVVTGIVRSSVALSQLLVAGIGDTIRVSLSGSCEDEISAAREILRVSGMSRGGARIVSCPKCGRAGFDVHRFLAENREWLDTIEEEVTIAVMGCEVNGPEEAKHADFGITGSGGKAVVFRRGRIVARTTEAEGGVLLRREVDAWREEYSRR